MDDNELKELSKRLETSRTKDQLNLSNRNLKEIPFFVQQLTNLKYLYLDNNKLIFVPEIGQFTQLEEISIENNQLTLIPESFCNLKNLKCLNLSKNNLKCISSQIFTSLTSLTSLWLNNCDLMYLPREVSCLKHLEKLGLKCNCLQDVPEELGSLTRLQWLNLEQNQLSSLPEQLSQLKSLAYLNLNKNKFEEIPTNVLLNLKQLNVLNISNNLIKLFKDEDIIGLAHVNKVDLIDNPFIKKQFDVLERLNPLENFKIKKE